MQILTKKYEVLTEYRKEEIMSVAYAVDTGNFNIKTENFEFPANYLEFPTYPVWVDKDEVFEIDGKFYALQKGVPNYYADKTINERYFNLTMFALAKEIYNKNKDEDPEKSAGMLRDIVLLAGLPPAHMLNADTRNKYIAYFKTNGEVTTVKYMDRLFNIRISDVILNAQCYAACVAYVGQLELQPHTVIIDIGGHTVDVIGLDMDPVTKQSKINKNFVFSIDAGTDVLFNEVEGQMAKYNIMFDETTLNVMLSGDQKMIDGLYLSDACEREILDITQKFVMDKIIGALIRKGMHLNNYMAVFVGGGSILLEKTIEETAGEYIAEMVFIRDTKANVKGYKALYRHH